MVPLGILGIAQLHSDACKAKYVLRREFSRAVFVFCATPVAQNMKITRENTRRLNIIRCSGLIANAEKKKASQHTKKMKGLVIGRESCSDTGSDILKLWACSVMWNLACLFPVQGSPYWKAWTELKICSTSSSIITHLRPCETSHTSTISKVGSISSFYATIFSISHLCVW